MPRRTSSGPKPGTNLKRIGRTRSTKSWKRRPSRSTTIAGRRSDGRLERRGGAGSGAWRRIASCWGSRDGRSGTFARGAGGGRGARGPGAAGLAGQGVALRGVAGARGQTRPSAVCYGARRSRRRRRWRVCSSPTSTSSSRAGGRFSNGRKVNLSRGASGLVLDAMVE